VFHVSCYLLSAHSHGRFGAVSSFSCERASQNPEACRSVERTISPSLGASLRNGAISRAEDEANIDTGYDQARPRYSTAGSSYYGRPATRDSYVDNGNGNGPLHAPTPRQRINPRMQSDPTLARYPNPNTPAGPAGPAGPYGGSGLQQSRDTVDTGASGSGSEQWTNSTDPSSENSSIDRVKTSPAKIGEYEAQHGYPDYPSIGNPQFGGPIMEEGGYGQTRVSNDYGGAPSNANGNGYFAQNSSDGPLPAPPPTAGVPARKIISLGGNPNSTPLQASSGNVGRPALQSQPSQKRKSWLRRKFSTKE
jgi:hypothetical protein